MARQFQVVSDCLTGAHCPGAIGNPNTATARQHVAILSLRELDPDVALAVAMAHPRSIVLGIFIHRRRTGLERLCHAKAPGALRFGLGQSYPGSAVGLLASAIVLDSRNSSIWPACSRLHTCNDRLHGHIHLHL